MVVFMRRLLQCFLPLLFPFCLSLLPLLGLFLETRLRDRFEFEQEKARWRTNAQNLIEEVRLISSYEAQTNQMVAELKRRFLRITDPGVELSGKLLKAGIEKVFPSSHFPKDGLIFGFKRRMDGKLELLNEPGLSIQGGRLLGDFFTRCLQIENVQPDERRNLQNRCQGLFGQDISFEQVAVSRRGKATFVRYNGIPSIIIWDTLHTNARILGAFVCVLPVEVAQSFDPLSFALRRVKARHPGMFPMLLPIDFTSVSERAVFPGGFKVPSAVRNIARYFDGRRDSPERLGNTRFHEKIRNWWILEDLFTIDSSHKILVVGPVFKARMSSGKALLLLFGLLWGCLWGAVVLKVIAQGKPLPMSMRFWVMSFFSMLAIISLSALFYFGSYYIDTALSRRANDEMSQFRERLENVETGISNVFQHHTRYCRQFLFDREWCEKILSLSSRAKEKLFQDTAAFLRRQTPAIFLDGMMVFGFSPYREVEVFTTRGSLLATKQLGTDVFMAFVHGTVKNYDESIASQAALASGTGKLGNTYGHLFASLLDPSVFTGFSNMRQRAGIMETAGNPVILFYDFFAKAGRVLGGVVMLMNPVDAYRTYLLKSISMLSFQSGDHQFAFGERVNGCHQPVFPPLGGLWKQRKGRQLRSLMDLATEMGTEQVLEFPSSAMVARPSPSLKGFILGGIVSFERLQRDAALQRSFLFVTILLLLALFVVLGYATSNYLLVPLSKLEGALRKLGAGDLSVRVGLSRSDELGDLTASFDRMIQGIQERQELGLFVSKSLDATIGAAAAEPEQKMGTILVSDLRNFTTLSESHPPTEIITMLNHHHHAMAEVIQRCGGIVELFIGDAVVAVFYEQNDGDGARSALTAAKEMMVTHRRIQEQRRQDGGFLYETGIGCDRGLILAGSLGTADRSEYVVLGRPRNRAEALEASSKKGRFTRIVVSDAVAEHCCDDRFVPIEGAEGLELEGPV